MVQLNFDSTKPSAQPDKSFLPIPDGWYKAEIIDSSEAETKKKISGEAKKGKMLKLTYRLVEGEHEGRLVFCNLNLENDNPKAEEIAERNLGDICRAVQILNVSESSQLHEIPHMIKLKVRKSEEYGDSNDIKGFKPLSGPGAPPASAQGGASAPWNAKKA